MRSSRENIREQVMAQIITTMEQAIAEGRDPMEVAEAAYPGTPDTVLFLAMADAEDRRTEAWWRNIENSIDSAFIRAALAAQSSKPVSADSRDAHLDEAFATLSNADAAEDITAWLGGADGR